MAIDLLAPAEALKAILMPEDTPVGTIAAITTRTPDPPYSGSLPLLCIRPLPLNGSVAIEGAGGYRLDGTLACWYLDSTAEEQNRSIGDIEADMVSNLNAIISQILANMSLGGVVVSVKPPIGVQGDEAGPYRQVGDAIWVFAELRVPYLGRPSCS